MEILNQDQDIYNVKTEEEAIFLAGKRGTVSNGYGARSEVEKTAIALLSNSDTGKDDKNDQN